MTGLVAGSSAAAALGSVLVACGSLDGGRSALSASLFTAVVGLVLLLRARTHSEMPRRIALGAGGLVSVAAGLAVIVMSEPGQAYWATLLTAAAGAVALGWLHGYPVSPVVRRSVEVVEYLSPGGRAAPRVLGRRPLRPGSWSEPVVTACARRSVRILAAALLGALPLYTAPPVAAETPPAVDNSFLPKPGSPAPPRRTEQHQQCATFATRDDEARDAEQLKALDLPGVWELSRGSGQTVAVIDTGVSRHRRLPHLVPGGDYVSAGDGTDDCDGHGTIVAGIIGAAPDPHDGSAFSGIAPDATIISVRQSSNKFRAADDVSGSGFGDVDTLAMAVRTAADMGATVINVSSVACLPARGRA